ncbi:hypothetical protein [Roseateles sp.]|jgi:hypothetical protein|uniref:hypothetical protein n=1 Tax=Roseateles sp. TaxID=1971397 RepID=UPI003BA7A7B4
MSYNYDASQVGVPYVRAHRIEILYPDAGQLPQAFIEQSLAVKLADGTVRKLEDLPPIRAEFDLANDGLRPIPLVDPSSAAPLGVDTNLRNVMLAILAVVRKQQLLVQG